MPKTSKKRAFTLTELLVVVIVIGVLAAVVLPKYSKVLETRKTTEAEELMAAVRMEQEQRCALDKPYLSTATQLHTLASATTKNYAYSLGAGGMSASSTGGSYNYTLEMPSYADGRICCSGTDCNKLNKDYPSCDALKALADYQEATAECEASGLGCDEGTKPSCLPANPNLCGAQAGDAYCAGTEWACVGVVQGSANPGEETVACETEDGKTGTRTCPHICLAGEWVLSDNCTECQPSAPTPKTCSGWKSEEPSLCSSQGMGWKSFANPGLDKPTSNPEHECCVPCKDLGLWWDDDSNRCRESGWELTVTKEYIEYSVTPYDDAVALPLRMGKGGDFAQIVGTDPTPGCSTGASCYQATDDVCALAFLDSAGPGVVTGSPCTDTWCGDAGCLDPDKPCNAKECYELDAPWSAFMAKGEVIAEVRNLSDAPEVVSGVVDLTKPINKWSGLAILTDDQGREGQVVSTGALHCDGYSYTTLGGCETTKNIEPTRECVSVNTSYFRPVRGETTTCQANNCSTIGSVYWYKNYYASPKIDYRYPVKKCTKK